MSNDELTIRVQPLEEPWVTLGAGEWRGIHPENFRASSNAHGSDTASFALRRDPGAPIPDLQAFTPVEVEVGGVKVWSGRIKETPINDGNDAKISVECQGWQYHLDDDVYERTYIHTRLSDWTDVRSLTQINLNLWPGSASVSQDRQISCSFPKDITIRNTAAVGVFLDLGPDPNSWAQYVSVDALFPHLSASLWFFCRGAHTLGGDHFNGNPSDYNDAWAIQNPTNGRYNGALATPRRYVCLFYWFNAADQGFPWEYALWMTDIRVYSQNDATFHSGGLQTLKASTIIKDAVNKATLQLSSDQTNIVDMAATPGSYFTVPDFSMTSGPRTTRETVEAANAFHDFMYKVDVEKKVHFQPKPTVPSVEIGSWPGVEFSDASANSGEEIYNRVVVTGTAPNGDIIRSARYTAGLPEIAKDSVLSNVQLTNAKFLTNVTGWNSNGPLVWLSGGPASTGGYMMVQNSPTPGVYFANSSFAGTFKKGKAYKVTIWSQTPESNTTVTTHIHFGHWASGDLAFLDITPYEIRASFREYTLIWVPSVDRTSAEIRMSWSSNQIHDAYIDDVTLYESRATLLDRRGLNRAKILPINSPLTKTVGDQIGDVFLRAHRTTPFKGSFTAQGGIRRALGGAPVHPAELLLATSQLVRVSHRIDPDTGAWGRDGVMASVEYDHDQRQSVVQIDNQRRNFEAFLERLAVVTGNALQS